MRISWTQLGFILSIALHSWAFIALTYSSISKTIVLSGESGPAYTEISYIEPTPSKSVSPEIEKKPLSKAKKLLDANSEFLLAQKKKLKTKKLAKTKSTNKKQAPTQPKYFQLGGGGTNSSKELQSYFSNMRRDLERYKVYPRVAKRLKQTGKVYVHFDVLPNGEIKNIRIKKSSSFDRLDIAAKELLSKIKKMPNLPSEIKGNLITVGVYIDYQL